MYYLVFFLHYYKVHFFKSVLKCVKKHNHESGLFSTFLKYTFKILSILYWKKNNK